MLRGVRFTTGGTDFVAVTRHALEMRVRRALVLTDGWVGDVPEEHARELAWRGTRFAAVVTFNGDPSFASALDAKIWQLPSLEGRVGAGGAR